MQRFIAVLVVRFLYLFAAAAFCFFDHLCGGLFSASCCCFVFVFFAVARTTGGSRMAHRKNVTHQRWYSATQARRAQSHLFPEGETTKMQGNKGPPPMIAHAHKHTLALQTLIGVGGRLAVSLVVVIVVVVVVVVGDDDDDDSDGCGGGGGCTLHCVLVHVVSHQPRKPRVVHVKSKHRFTLAKNREVGIARTPAMYCSTGLIVLQWAGSHGAFGCNFTVRRSWVWVDGRAARRHHPVAPVK